MKTRVAIFDDNLERREGLFLLLETIDDLNCVGLYNDCRNVLADIESSNPDVVLMDIDMPHVNGIEGVLEIRKVHPDLKILMQTVFEDDDKIFAAICAGADGYILKQANPMKLVDGIREVLVGGAPMTPVIAAKVLKLFQKQGSSKKGNNFDLTKRESEILNLLVKGFSYKMIAEECHISYPTVNSHITKIYGKLKVQSSAGAVAVALREGLVK
ncbi:response regulator transcription factor [Cryomorphaceae bacterium 1068]|nr:response regulator transcription factor [Cryomorphaceae bacterium 1068]